MANYYKNCENAKNSVAKAELYFRGVGNKWIEMVAE